MDNYLPCALYFKTLINRFTNCTEGHFNNTSPLYSENPAFWSCAGAMGLLVPVTTSPQRDSCFRWKRAKSRAK